MAEKGLAPPVFARRHPRLRTPLNAILLQMAIIALLIGLDFQMILCIDNFFSSAAAVLEFAAAIQLRRARPHLPRPFRVQLGTRALGLVLVVPSCISVAMMGVTAAESKATLVIISLALIAGVLLYLPFRRWRPRWLAQVEGGRAAADPELR